MAKLTWGERYRAAFIENATKRGFRDVEFRQVGDKRVVWCDNGRGGEQPRPMDPKTEVLIGRYVAKKLESE